MPATEADKLKIAFAEGYIAANPTNAPPNQSRTYRWLRTVQQILAIAVFTAILASLMGNAQLVKLSFTVPNAGDKISNQLLFLVKVRLVEEYSESMFQMETKYILKRLL